MSLDRLQRALGDAIRGAPNVDVRAVAEEIIAPGPRAPADQLETYREQFWRRHYGSLREDYSALEHAMGEESFERLVRAYLAAHPPQRFHLRDLGARLPELVAGTAPWSDDPMLADCARLEWALIEAFDAADAPPLDPATVASLGEDDWPRARLALHPSVRLVTVAHCVHVWRTALRAGQTPPRPDARAEAYVVYRRAESVWVEIVDEAALALLERLARGEPLGAACEGASALDPDVEGKLGDWFQRWVALGWIVRVAV